MGNHSRLCWATRGALGGVAAGLALLSVPGVGVAGPETARAEAAAPPGGWVRYCWTGAGLCDAHPAQTVVLDDARRDALTVTHAAARRLLFVPEARFGSTQADVWRYPSDGIADCEDAVIWMMTELTERQGWPRGALTMGIYRHWTDTLHVVLLAHTDRGVLVLDTLSKHIHAAAERPEDWVMAQRPGQPQQWVGGAPAGAPATLIAEPQEEAPDARPAS